MNRTRALTSLIALVLLTAAGCNIVAPIAYIIEGPPKVPAEYTLLDRPTVVFVDDRGSVIPANARAIRRSIADKVSEELMVRKLVTVTISPRDAMALASARDKHGELMAIDEIGREVGAEQILYIEMISFALTPDGVIPKPTAVCQVRLIDTQERARLYPQGDDGGQVARTLQASLPELDPTTFNSAASRLKIYEALADVTGDQITKLFYEHEKKELGGQLTPK
jgi:hypothetical protein